MFAVANSALINMLMASRLLYGMAKQRVLPPPLGRVHPVRRTPWVAIIFTTLLAFGLITYVSLAGDEVIKTLGGTTALLLLGVFTIVNAAVLVLRRDRVDHDHFVTPTAMAVAGSIACAYLVTPLSGRDVAQYEVAGLLLALGVVLWGITMLINRSMGVRPTRLEDPNILDTRGPVN
jgi:amino acid transporter